MVHWRWPRAATTAADRPADEAREAFQFALDVALAAVVASLFALSVGEYLIGSPHVGFTFQVRLAVLAVVVPMVMLGRWVGPRHQPIVALAFSGVLMASAIAQDLVTKDPYGGILACVGLPLLSAWVLPWRLVYQVVLATIAIAALVLREVGMPHGAGVVPVVLILGSVPVSVLTNRSRAALHAARAEAAQIKDRLLANVSHEIRTPLNGLVGTMDLLARSPLAPAQRVQLETMRECGRLLVSLADEILTFSRVDAGRVEMVLVDFAPGDVVAHVTGLFAAQAREKAIALAHRIELPPLAVFRGDPARLRQILVNLVSNAVKFTDRGRVEICVTAAQDSAVASGLRFEVRDTGIGMDRATQTRVFEAFIQAETELVRRRGGVGLGLAIARGLADLMGGHLSVDSAVGRGSTFTLSLTLPKVEVPETGSRSLPLGRVLVAVARQADGASLVERLRAWGGEAEWVSGDARCQVRLREAHASGQPFALLLADPRSLGRQAAQLTGWVRAAVPDAPPAVGILASCAETDEALESFDTGIAFHLNAPTHPDRLFEALRGGRADHRPVSPAGVPRARLLVVEDDPLNRQVVSHMLTELGIDVRFAEDGASVLAVLDTGNIDAVLMDCHLPDIDGYELTRRIRAHVTGTGRRLPVIALTASVTSGERARAAAAGMDDFLGKPLQFEALGDCLARWGIGDRAAGVADLVRVAKVTGGDRNRRAQFAAMLRDEVERLTALLRADPCPDAGAVGAAVHRLKGAAANFGAVGLLACLDLIDLAECDRPTCSAHAERIDACHAAFAAALDASEG